MIELELTNSFFRHKVPLSRPSYLSYTDEVCEAVNKVIRSGFIAQGKVTEEFESRIAEYTGCRYAVAVSSGTAGLFLCLKACGIGLGDEVITTPFSFIASTNVIVHAGAKPLFCDIDRDTYNISANKLSALVSGRPWANKPLNILPVDVFGNPFDTNTINKICPTKANIISDSCESFGSKMERPFDCCVYAFYGNKLITTAEGGCIVTNNKNIADYCKAARNQGRVPGDTWLDSSLLGWNFRISDVHAAIGLVQLKHLGDIVEARTKVIERYISNEVCLSQSINYKRYNPFVMVVECDNRDKVMRYMLDHEIEVKPYFPTIHKQKCMKEFNNSTYPVAEEVASRTIALPYCASMTNQEVDFVCQTFKEAVKHGI